MTVVQAPVGPSFQERVRSCIEEGIVNPDDIADHIGRELSRHQKTDLFPVLLRRYVADVMRTLRNNAGNGDGSKTQSGSRKWDAVRRWYGSCTLLIDGEWKKLADLSADDLDSAARTRRDEASAVLASAEKIEKLAAKCREANVDRVDDLPDAADVAWEILR